MKRALVASTPKQIAAISSPGRDEMVDMIGVIGPCTVGELARAMGRSRHGLYYHLRALAAAGLIRPVRGPRRGSHDTLRYEVAGRPLVVRFDISSAKSRRAVLELAHTRLRSGIRGFDRACSPDIATAEGPRRNLWATRWKGWLSPSELEVVNRCLETVIALMKSRPDGPDRERKCYEFTFVFVPTVPQPVPAPSARKRLRRR